MEIHQNEVHGVLIKQTITGFLSFKIYFGWLGRAALISFYMVHLLPVYNVNTENGTDHLCIDLRKLHRKVDFQILKYKLSYFCSSLPVYDHFSAL